MQVSLVGLLVLLTIAGICGAIGQTLAGFSRGGCLASIALGFIGALLGHWIQRQMNLPEPLSLDVGGGRFPIIWSIIGATIFVAVLGLITRKRSGPGE